MKRTTEVPRDQVAAWLRDYRALVPPHRPWLKALGFVVLLVATYAVLELIHTATVLP